MVPPAGLLGRVGFLSKLSKARCAVPLVSLNSAQISRQERPRARRVSNWRPARQPANVLPLPQPVFRTHADRP